MADLRKQALNVDYNKCYDISATPEREGKFPETTGVQGARTDGRPRSGAPEAGSVFKVKRGFGAATKGK